MNQLTSLPRPSFPALVAASGERAGIRFLEFFAANIRNSHTAGLWPRRGRDSGVVWERSRNHIYSVYSVGLGLR